MNDKKRYLNCKYLDAGMDGMLCSRNLYTSCKEFNGGRCSYYTPENKMNDKQQIVNEIKQDFKVREEEHKQIEELYDIMTNCCDKNEDVCTETMNCDECRAIAVYNASYRKLPKDSVVIPKEKFIKANKVYSYSTLKSYTKSDLIEHIRILEHNWAVAEERIDNQAKYLGKLIKQLEQARKETAREIYQELQGHGTTYVKKWIKEHYGVGGNNEK